MDDNIDLPIERALYYHDAEAPPDCCPRCGQPLVQFRGPYVLGTYSGTEPGDTLFIGGDFGFLCPHCATAVAHRPALAAMLEIALEQRPDWNIGSRIMLLGLVDLDAVPPEQMDLPLDELDDIPIAPFYAPTKPGKKRQTHRKRPRKPTRRLKRKRRK